MKAFALRLTLLSSSPSEPTKLNLYRLTGHVVQYACKTWLLSLWVTSPCYAESEPTPIWIGQFDAAAPFPPPPWQQVRFSEQVPATVFQVREWDGITGVETHASNSMAMLTRPLHQSIEATPTLCWRWRIDAVLLKGNMATKQGDDYAARVTVAFKVPGQKLNLLEQIKLGLLRQRYGAQIPDAAISYVWDNIHAAGTSGWNAYTNRVLMVVARSGNDQAHRWVTERVNLLADFRKNFTDNNPELAGLAIATDTDNSGGDAHAGFAEFHLVSDDAPCAFAVAEPTAIPVDRQTDGH